jgi:hypothetical protein
MQLRRVLIVATPSLAIWGETDMTLPILSLWKNDINDTWATLADWTNGAPNSGRVSAVLGTMTTAYMLRARQTKRFPHSKSIRAPL